MALAVGARLGHYTVTAKLGEGSMGQVWQATDTKLNRQVALKILPEAFAADPDRLARFQREAQVLASLNHPNIAAIHGIEEADDTRALVLELGDGSTVAELIAHGSIPVDEAFLIAEQIAVALEAAHNAGVVHRDLKPANVKVRDDGTVKVLDLGLAKRLDESQLLDSQTITRDVLTGAGIVLGTPCYMSPEQAVGGKVDGRSDIFSFGVLFYELLTQTHPFRKDNGSDTLAAIVRDPPWPPLGGVPLEAVDLFNRLLEKRPSDRYRSFAEVRADLRRVLETSSGSSKQNQRAEPVGSRKSKAFSQSSLGSQVLAGPFCRHRGY